ncbi:hypothetical protein [Streptomyces sp. NRRL S-87]|uniref:hypothetical protein n=1 Tax=Streptomyces sp. NRRL S-87 TaxID=1463920 RepID=UPI00131C827F|nr:hypothetical protein [Streptomyces sp. NRRL S-87]
MSDHEAAFRQAVRAVLDEAGFPESAAGAEGVRTVRHARGMMVGWTPRDIPHLRVLRRGLRRARTPERTDLPGLRHAFALALAAAFRDAGFAVEAHGDEWLLVVRPEP